MDFVRCPQNAFLTLPIDGLAEILICLGIFVNEIYYQVFDYPRSPFAFTLRCECFADSAPKFLLGLSHFYLSHAPNLLSPYAPTLMLSIL
jgi:hypothetical protein